ncbi:hypothetical protein [Chitinimonas lacunae]|uniref:Phage tail protein n=1 Tax=Chitinimonas lacunae TaxID=1963018 RepID=A0ABV8MYT7_9NEIS
MIYPVHYYDSTMPGAPVLVGQPGSLLSLLLGCLVDGFGLKTVETLNQVGGLATATVSTSHGLKPGDVFAIAGATPAGWNSEWRALRTPTPATVEFAVPLDLNLPAATGAITLKRPGAGWERAFTAPNKAVFRAAVGNRRPLRIDDTDPQYTRVRAYLTMTDIDNGDSPCPPLAIRPTGLTWRKSISRDATPRAWSLIADDRAFYLTIDGSGDLAAAWYAFGDLTTLGSAADAMGTLLTGQENDAPGSADVEFARDLLTTSDEIGRWLVGRAGGMGGPVRFTLQGHRATERLCGHGPIQYPCPVGDRNAAVLHPVLVVESGGRIVRGVLPGAMQSLHPVQVVMPYERTSGPSGRDYRWLPMRSWPATWGTAPHDATGPWR